MRLYFEVHGSNPRKVSRKLDIISDLPTDKGRGTVTDRGRKIRCLSYIY